MQIDADHHTQFYDNKEGLDWYMREKDLEQAKKPVYLDHVRTSSGVRFRGYWVWK